MAIDLTIYSSSKDRICIGYFGNCNEYLHQLLHLRPDIEFQLPGITIYIACRDASFDEINSEPNTLCMTQLRNRKLEFGRFHEILSSGDEHPIEKMMVESSLDIPHLDNDAEPENPRCLIVTKGEWPTKSLSDEQAGVLSSLAISRGLRPEQGDDWRSVGHVWGVESKELWNKAKQCQKGALLVPTGVGINFYTTIFPRLEVREM